MLTVKIVSRSWTPLRLAHVEVGAVYGSSAVGKGCVIRLEAMSNLPDGFRLPVTLKLFT